MPILIKALILTVLLLAFIYATVKLDKTRQEGRKNMVALLLEIEDRGGNNLFIRFRTSGIASGTPDEQKYGAFYRDLLKTAQDVCAESSGKASMITVQNRELTPEELDSVKKSYFKK